MTSARTTEDNGTRRPDVRRANADDDCAIDLALPAGLYQMLGGFLGAACQTRSLMRLELGRGFPQPIRPCHKHVTRAHRADVEQKGHTTFTPKSEFDFPYCSAPKSLWSYLDNRIAVPTKSGRIVVPKSSRRRPDAVLWLGWACLQ